METTPREDKDKMDELLTMSKTELTRLEIMKRLEEKRHKQKEAADALGHIAVLVILVSPAAGEARHGVYVIAVA